MGNNLSKMDDSISSFDISEAERSLPDEVDLRNHIGRDCAICLMAMDNEHTLKYCRFGCGIPIHRNCVRHWNGPCPTCRDELFFL